ncbi:hypothetical protein [Polaromonas vacuolata]|uniref:hypothetical protein n=1 Tax=Polaromonas vacuolata TaxID=37448 RepID=UPI00145702A1|nr:hypothetical protein [Polaromonas vacuolata]
MHAGVGNVTLNYRQRQHGGEWEDVSYSVGLAHTLQLRRSACLVAMPDAGL